jgi:hypothetical protein
VREEIFAAAIGSDEAKALSVVEPLDGTGFHNYVFLKLGEEGRSPGAHEDQGRVIGQPEYLMGATYERPIHTRHLKSCTAVIRLNSVAVNTIIASQHPRLLALSLTNLSFDDVFFVGDGSFRTN